MHPASPIRAALAFLVFTSAVVSCGDDTSPGGAASTSASQASSGAGKSATSTGTASGSGVGTTTSGTSAATGASTSGAATSTTVTSAASSTADASSASVSVASSSGAGGAPPTTTIRIVAGNLTTGDFQSYTPGHGARIFAGSKADVALIQEMNAGNNSNADLRDFIDEAFGASFEYTRGSGDLPNGIASRFPIVASGEWDDPQATNRELTWARIDVPGPVDLWAVSVHLLTSSAANRNLEAAALVGFIDANVPAGDYLVLGGDFNTDTRAEAAVTTLSSHFVTGGPFPVDQAGNEFTNAGRTKPYDWVLARPSLDALATPTVFPSASFPTGLVVDTRVYVPIADLSPALATDSGGPSMQHMLVARDFALPTP